MEGHGSRSINTDYSLVLIGVNPRKSAASNFFTLLDAQDVRICVISKVERRAIGVAYQRKPRRAIVGVGGHDSHAVLHAGGLVRVIGVVVGEGQGAAAGAGDRRGPVRPELIRGFSSSGIYRYLDVFMLRTAEERRIRVPLRYGHVWATRSEGKGTAAPIRGAINRRSQHM